MERTTPQQRHEVFLRHEPEIKAYLTAKLGAPVYYLRYDGGGGEALCHGRNAVMIGQFVHDWVNAELEGLQQNPEVDPTEWTRRTQPRGA